MRMEGIARANETIVDEEVEIGRKFGQQSLAK
jgi:hypothetical protein